MTEGRTPNSNTGARRQLGRYEIVEHLATGGMAEIYKAYTAKHRPFIIKKVLPEYATNEDFVKMFVDEAKISLSLKHPNIVRVLDLGQMEGTYYLAMEYVFGQDLGSLLKKSLESRVHIPIDAACYIIMQCCRGLDYAHNSKDSFGNSVSIVHRDISPPNILVSFNGEAKILDFGIAKAVSAMDKSQTRSGVLKGKFCYMSPEQARGEALNHLSDVFSIGIVLHELLTSKSLFYTKDEIETLERVRKAEVPPPSKIRKGVPKALDKIVLQALQLKKTKRTQGCGALADALHLFLKENYPRTDARSVAKVLRSLFHADFSLRMNTARKEGWRDIFISGAADEDILFDKTLDSPSQIGGRQIIVQEEISWINRLLYDPKTSKKFFSTLKAAGFLIGFGVLSFFAWKNGLFDQSYQMAKEVYLKNFSKDKPGPIIAEQKKEEILKADKAEPGSFAFFLQESKKAEDSENFSEAVNWLNKAIRINRFDLNVLIRRNFLLIRMGDYRESCHWFSTESEVPKRDKIFAQALCREAQGDKNGAIQTYQDYIKNFPSDERNPKIKQVVESLSNKENN